MDESNDESASTIEEASLLEKDMAAGGSVGKETPKAAGETPVKGQGTKKMKVENVID